MGRESMSYDVVIVGAGPAGLSTAIQYAQLCRKANKQPSVCIIEKGQEVGSHILSGAAIDPRALNELIPDWRTLNAPIDTPCTKDEFILLSNRSSFRLPTPPQMDNTGNYIISLGLLCHWLAEYAQNLGVDIFPGFAASNVIKNADNTIIGIQTGDKGVDKQGKPKNNFQPGIDLFAKQTVLAEGCRGSLSQHIIKEFALDKNSQPQTYGIGIKEVWEISPEKHRKGTVMHTIGWPLDYSTYGGSFVYYWGENLVSIGFIIGLDYKNTYLNPFQEFQRFKHHPRIQPILENGRCLAYGARAINEGGWQSIPKLTFPGGMLVGCSAGFLDVSKIKGTHNAMKSGMLAAEAIFEKLENNTLGNEIIEYSQKIKNSWIEKELYVARNIRPAFHGGLLRGLCYSAIDTYLFRGHAPWTFSHHKDNQSLLPADQCKPIEYSKPDGKISFDRMTSVAMTNVYHDENEPCHLKIIDPTIPVAINWKQYAGPEQRYCPAGVYEFLDDEFGNKRLQINATNCIHCKTCDIKDPMQNIVWTPPEGGEGPGYEMM